MVVIGYSFAVVKVHFLVLGGYMVMSGSCTWGSMVVDVYEQCRVVLELVVVVSKQFLVLCVV